MRRAALEMRRPRMGEVGSMALSLLLLASQPMRDANTPARWFARDGAGRHAVKSDDLPSRARA
jgi:hypothetical protein